MISHKSVLADLSDCSDSGCDFITDFRVSDYESPDSLLLVNETPNGFSEFAKNPKSSSQLNLSASD